MFFCDYFSENLTKEIEEVKTLLKTQLNSDDANTAINLIDKLAGLKQQ